MEILVIIFILASPFLIYFYISNQIRYNAEGKTLFKGKINKNRAAFLEIIFGLDQEKLRFIHFDGLFFHLDSKYPYSNFLSVELISSEDVEVVNPDIPHFKTWQHTRIDGGRDRRYSNNPVTRNSTKYNLVFRGSEDIKCILYEKWPDYRLNEILEKINAYLGIAREMDIEAVFNEYKGLAACQKSVQSALEEKIKEKNKLTDVISASQRLSAQELPSDFAELQTKRTSLEEEILYLQNQLASITSDLDSLIHNLKDTIGKHRDKQKVREYYSSLKAAG